MPLPSPPHTVSTQLLYLAADYLPKGREPARLADAPAGEPHPVDYPGLLRRVQAVACVEQYDEEDEAGEMEGLNGRKKRKGKGKARAAKPMPPAEETCLDTTAATGEVGAGAVASGSSSTSTVDIKGKGKVREGDEVKVGEDRRVESSSQLATSTSSSSLTSGVPSSLPAGAIPLLRHTLTYTFFAPVARAAPLSANKRHAPGSPAHARGASERARNELGLSDRERLVRLLRRDHALMIENQERNGNQETEVEMVYSLGSVKLGMWDEKKKTAKVAVVVSDADFSGEKTEREKGQEAVLLALPHPEVSHWDGVAYERLDGSGFEGAMAKSSWLAALAVLVSGSKPHVHIDASLSLVTLPDLLNPSPPPAEEGVVLAGSLLPFELRLTLDVALTRAALDPNQAASSFVKDNQRLFLTQVFPRAPDPAGYDAHGRTTTLPFFYSTLRPAPDLPVGLDPESIQPHGLIPQLLPFQQRSVAWLLQREGVAVAADPSGVTSEPSAVSSCIGWESIRLPLEVPPAIGELVVSDEEPSAAAETEAVVDLVWSRLSGTLVRSWDTVVHSSPEISLDVGSTKGGMLCEEMGLGKTLEVLAVVLLNPRPVNELGITRRDEELEVWCQTSKATLIVTPLTLTQQWCDEIAAHAPGLKVFVYEGWRKLPFKVTAGKDHAPVEGTDPKSKRRRVIDSDDEDDLRSNHEVGEEGGEAEWWQFMREGDFDVVITTYNVLQADFNVAKGSTKRPRRESVDYSTSYAKPRSPLVMIEFWRCVMDEVQLQGDGQTADMVSMIPRVSSLAVSGTPAKRATKDLHQALKFLRVPHFRSSWKLWQRLLERNFALAFEQLFGVLATRTTKAQVADEMHIPPQRRWIVPIELNAIEMTYYRDHLSRALEDLGFDEEGNGFELDVIMARTWLHTLRQIATHVQVGHLRAAAAPARRERSDRLDLGGDILSLDQVLEKMIEDVISEILTVQHRQFSSQTIHAMLLNQKNLSKWREDLDLQKSFELLSPVLTTVTAIIQDLEDEISELRVSDSPALKSTKALPPSRASDDADPKGKGRQEIDSDEEEDLSDDDISYSSGLQPNTRLNLKIGAKANRLREFLIIQHKAQFLLGDWYHQNKNEAAETDAYVKAEALRRRLLQEPENIVNGAIHKMTRRLGTTTAVRQDDLEIAECTTGGIIARPIYDRADEVIELLNQNYELVWNWRGKIFTLLSSPLQTAETAEIVKPSVKKELTSDSEGKAAADSSADATSKDGDAALEQDSYAKALDDQAEAEAYMQAYAAALGDRRELLVENRSALNEADARSIKARTTKRAGQAHAAGIDLGLHLNEDPQLKDTLNTEREALRLNPTKLKKDAESRKCLKSLLFEIIDAGHRAKNEIEIHLAETEAKRLRRTIKQQEEIIDKLEKESKIFQSAFNARIAFFRQLQEISDSVTEAIVGTEAAMAHKIRSCQESEDKRVPHIKSLTSKARYLRSMAAIHATGELEGGERDCPICLDSIEKGVLLACSHIFCESCFNNLKKSQEQRYRTGASCPVCRVTIDESRIHRVDLNRAHDAEEAKLIEQNDEVTAEVDADIAKAKLAHKIQIEAREADELNYLSDELRREVAEIEIFGSWGSKIDQMVKHLLYLRKTDIGSKAVVFSAFPDALMIIQAALDQNGIKFCTTSGSNSRTVAHEFKQDPEIQVFCLHGERESSGLTLTCARYVFLCEPTVQPSFELQAVGRVDRLGQTRSTEVYCYAAQNTIDSAVLRLSVHKGTSIYLKEALGTSLPINADRPDEGDIEGGLRARQLLQRKGVGKDFVARSDDLAALFFPDRHLSHPRTRHNDNDAGDDGTESWMDRESAMLVRQLMEDEARAGASAMEVDDWPVAGPSRLH